MRHFPVPPAARPARDDVHLVRRAHWDCAEYRALFRKIGTDWLWYGRLRLSDPALERLLGDPDVEIYTLTSMSGTDIGLLELDCRAGIEIELAYVGVVAEQLGTGHGAYLLAHAIERARCRGASRLWLHTCTHDHPRVIPFYRSRGFEVYATAVEITTDPRLDGTLPGDAAPHVALVAGTDRR